MAKRKNKGKSTRPSKHGQIWFDDDVGELLAWLDHCLFQQRNFEQTVIGHLKIRTRKTYTLAQVKRKLGTVWHMYARDSRDGKPSEIYFQGTQCLENLYPDIRSHLEKAKKLLRHDEQNSLRYRLRSTSTLRPTPQTMPAMSSSSSSLSPPGSSTSSLSPPPSSPEPASTESDAEEDVKQVLEIEDDDESPEAKGPILFKDSSTQTTPWYTNRNGNPDSNKDPPQQSSPRASSAPNQINDASTELLLQKKEASITAKNNRILSLENELGSIRKEYEELKECVNDPSRTGNKADLAYENSVLKEQLESMQYTDRTVRQINNNLTGLSDREMASRMDNLEGLIKETLGSFPTNKDSAVNFSKSSNPRLLAHWTQRALGCTEDALEALVSECTFERRQILRSLVAAGIFHLIFESPVYEFLSKESALLDKYREFLLEREGPDFLRIIDVLGHKSLLTGAFFEAELMQEKTQDLANTLADILAPYYQGREEIDASDEEMYPDSRASSIQDESEKRPSHLRSVCRESLKVKAELLLSSKRYKASFVTAGTKFDPTTMNKNGWNFDGYTQRAQIGKRKGAAARAQVCEKSVRLCIFPAIYSCAGTESEAGASRSTVDYQNFQLGGWTEPMTSANLVAKAVVLL